MNQTTWIVGGAIILVILAGWLYTMSGGNAKTDTSSATAQLSVQNNATDTLLASSSTSTKPMDNTENTSSAPKTEANATTPSSATLHTTMGDITVRFYPSDAPKTVENFVKLSRSGFYDGVRFHRVIKGFMIQSGDPLSKDDSQMDRWGMGGPGYQFNDEIDPSSALYQKGYKHGVLAMANSGPNTNGSQFFIMAADYPLPPLYTIFGEVTSGLDVVDKIDAVPTDGSAQTGGHDRPLTPVTITSVEVR